MRIWRDCGWRVWWYGERFSLLGSGYWAIGGWRGLSRRRMVEVEENVEVSRDLHGFSFEISISLMRGKGRLRRW